MDYIAFLIGVSVLFQFVYFGIKIKGEKIIDRLLDKEGFYLFLKILLVCCLISLVFLISALIKLNYDRI
jgi:hypothetical protein